MQRTASAKTTAGSTTCISTRSIRHPLNDSLVKGSDSPLPRTKLVRSLSILFEAAFSRTELGSTPIACSPTELKRTKS